MSKTTRRNFLKQSAIAATAVGAVPYFFSSQQPALAQQAPSDRLRMGCLAVGQEGRARARDFNGLVDIVAICDVDSQHMEAAQEDNNIGRRGVRLDAYKDYRRILDRNDIDVVSVCSPDHWHTKMCIEAMQAGKHVFCEKPLTLTIEENQLIRNACKKYNKVFQVGTQQRSQRNQFALAALMVRAGLLGKVQRVVCDIGGGGRSGVLPKADVPESLDFEMWLGQAPLAEYVASPEMHNAGRLYARPRQSRVHFEFRWWYDYSGGTFTDWGAHHVDCAMWALDRLDDGTGPVKIRPIVAEHSMPFVDGWPTIDNQYNTSFNFDVECTFEDGLVMHVVSRSQDGNGILFEGTEGRIHVSRGRIAGRPFEQFAGSPYGRDRDVPYDQILRNIAEVFPDEAFAELYNGKRFEGGHYRNFINCIRDGGLPVSDVYTHVQAMNVCHLCVIAARLGREVTWDPVLERTGDTQSQSFVARKQRRGYEIPRV